MSPEADQALARYGSIASIVGLIPILTGFVTLLSNPTEPAVIGGFARIEAVVVVGLLVAIAHGVLWTGTEKLFGWSFGSGGGGSLPRGWQAVLLSLSITLPLQYLPGLYQWASGSQLIAPRHYIASGYVLVAAALGHLLLYGTRTPHFAGLRNIVAASYPDLHKAIAMEALYCFVHFGSIVFVYQAAIETRLWPALLAVPFKTLTAGLVFMCATSGYIMIKYPESLNDPRAVELRGVVSGIALSIALLGGMLM